jgi:hypothetical protein
VSSSRSATKADAPPAARTEVGLERPWRSRLRRCSQPRRDALRAASVRDRGALATPRARRARPPRTRSAALPAC